MWGIYFHDFPEEFHQLTCGWNYTPRRCSHPCVADPISGGISILHGGFCTFMETGKEPMFRAVYEAFANIDLTLSVLNLEDLVTQVKVGMNLQTNTRRSPCAEFKGFEKLILERLERG